MEDFLARAVNVPVEVAVEVASSHLLFASFAFFSFPATSPSSAFQQTCPGLYQHPAWNESVYIGLLFLRKYHIFC